jgi:hypothetical protein
VRSILVELRGRPKYSGEDHKTHNDDRPGRKAPREVLSDPNLVGGDERAKQREDYYNCDLG